MVRPMSDPPALHIHHVSVRFGEVEALQDVSFDLSKGEFLAVVGPNGAGKSTLIKVALGLIKPGKGHAALFGTDAGKNPERIGYVPQLKTFDRSFPATALELVVSGLRRGVARQGQKGRKGTSTGGVGTSRRRHAPLPPPCQALRWRVAAGVFGAGFGPQT